MQPTASASKSRLHLQRVNLVFDFQTVYTVCNLTNTWKVEAKKLSLMAKTWKGSCQFSFVDWLLFLPRAGQHVQDIPHQTRARKVVHQGLLAVLILFYLGRESISNCCSVCQLQAIQYSSRDRYIYMYISLYINICMQLALQRDQDTCNLYCTSKWKPYLRTTAASSMSTASCIQSIPLNTE